jgi:hypothetical protein
MSDVNISAPPPSAPAPAAPAPANEAPINTNPVSSPQPIGSQAPPAPVDPDKHRGSSHRPMSRAEAARESIRKAFARAEEPGPAKPRMGHNNPPEEMKKEKAAPPKEETQGELNLKRRPDDQPRPRGEHGHFAAASAASTATDAQQPAQVAPSPQAGQPASPAPSNVIPLPEHAPYREPPRRFDERAKADWHAAPESVRASVHRMQQEFSQAYERMHGDHQEMERIRHFHDLAQQHGTTLEKALTNYTGMEAKLRADPVGGLDVIINNLNLRTPNGERIGLRDIAWHVLNQTPDQHQATQLQNSQSAIARQMQELREQQMAIAQATQQMQYEQRFAHTRGEVDRFAEAHPRLDELGDVIQSELALGFDLPTAYKRAELLRPAGPAAHAAQTRTAPAQTRTTDRSISGAPDRSSNGSGRGRSDKPAGRRDIIASAIRRASGAL